MAARVSELVRFGLAGALAAALVALSSAASLGTGMGRQADVVPPPLSPETHLSENGLVSAHYLELPEVSVNGAASPTAALSWSESETRTSACAGWVAVGPPDHLGEPEGVPVSGSAGVRPRPGLFGDGRSRGCRPVVAAVSDSGRVMATTESGSFRVFRPEMRRQWTPVGQVPDVCGPLWRVGWTLEDFTVVAAGEGHEKFVVLERCVTTRGAGDNFIEVTKARIWLAGTPGPGWAGEWRDTGQAPIGNCFDSRSDFSHTSHVDVSVLGPPSGSGPDQGLVAVTEACVRHKKSESSARLATAVLDPSTRRWSGLSVVRWPWWDYRLEAFSHVAAVDDVDGAGTPGLRVGLAEQTGVLPRTWQLGELTYTPETGWVRDDPLTGLSGTFVAADWNPAGAGVVVARAGTSLVVAHEAADRSSVSTASVEVAQSQRPRAVEPFEVEVLADGTGVVSHVTKSGTFRHHAYAQWLTWADPATPDPGAAYATGRVDQGEGRAIGVAALPAGADGDALVAWTPHGFRGLFTAVMDRGGAVTGTSG